MQHDTKSVLEELLGRWHSWAKGFSAVPVCGASAMFRSHISPKGYDSTADIADGIVNNAQMEAVEFNVGELADPYRAAIHILARNAYTGRHVWVSPRLPVDPLERGVIVGEARNQITKRLITAGVM